MEISRNEYFKKVQNCSKQEMEIYKIKPLDLSLYRLNDNTQRIADKNFMEETTDINGNYLLSGHWLSNLCYQFAEICKFDLVQIDELSAYAYSDEQMAIFTYCEGDITLTPFVDFEKYKAEKKRTINFYMNKDGKESY